MIKVKVIASGSKGNSCLITIDKINILIDIGISYKRLQESLNKNELTATDITAIFITHEHDDHISGLKVFSKRHNIPIYVPLNTEDYFKTLLNKENIYTVEKENFIDNVVISTIKTSHDSLGSNGYIIKSGDKSLAYVTDTGYINQKYLTKLTNHHVYIMESNHDEELLMNSTKPHHLKQRILSDKGHLSNYSSANYLKKIIGNNTTHIILAHLSEENNTEEHAHEMLVNTLTKDQLNNKKIIIARQREESELIEV